MSIRLDVVTIFPDYLAPLDLSLIGKARREGLVDLHVHDLRDFTHDRHRTVDDTPFGGGAGMVMKPQPWAEALDHVLAQPLASGNVVDRASTRRTQEGLGHAVPRLIVPGPGGVPFSQALAHELAAEAWLAFACGRYEGLDERVYEHAAERMPVTVVSLGDYVLNGGEVAVLAMVEAIVRLVPGVVGNAESLVEESHEDGLLEYPVYTKPAVWDDRGTERPVPPILLSGNHCAIAQWRHQQRLERTAARRPDLLHPSATGGALAALDGRVATAADAPELLTLQRACWVDQGRANDTWDIPPLVETLDDVRAGLTAYTTWVWRSGGRLVASGRGRRAPDDPTTWEVARLMVAPDLQGTGLGRAIMEFVETRAPADVTTFWLNTGHRSERLIRMYKKAGYRLSAAPARHQGTVELTKKRRRTS